MRKICLCSFFFSMFTFAVFGLNIFGALKVRSFSIIFIIFLDLILLYNKRKDRFCLSYYGRITIILQMIVSIV